MLLSKRQDEPHTIAYACAQDGRRYDQGDELP
jgi:hypothetical protein